MNKMNNCTWMQTYTGLAFSYDNLDESKIDILDIAHSLSLQCRYNGHCIAFYSIAEHCTRMSVWDKEADPLACLMHDATEAYIGDIVKPMKNLMNGSIKDIEEKINHIIFKKFGVHYVGEEIHKADLKMLATERRDLLNKCEKKWFALPAPYLQTIIPWRPYEAEEYFLRRFRELDRR